MGDRGRERIPSKGGGGGVFQRDLNPYLSKVSRKPWKHLPSTAMRAEPHSPPHTLVGS